MALSLDAHETDFGETVGETASILGSVSFDPTVAELLQQSRWHYSARRQYTGKQKQGVIVEAPDYAKATEEAQQALNLRLQAHQLDPEHTDPAWALDPVPHATLVAFLEKYVATP